MLTSRSIDWLNANYGDGRDWSVYLQDFDDDQLSAIIKEHRFQNGVKMLNYLYEHTDPEDKEKRAHLKGFESAASREHLLDVIGDLQNKCHE